MKTRRSRWAQDEQKDTLNSIKDRLRDLMRSIEIVPDQPETTSAIGEGKAGEPEQNRFTQPTESRP